MNYIQTEYEYHGTDVYDQLQNQHDSNYFSPTVDLQSFQQTMADDSGLVQGVDYDFIDGGNFKISFSFQDLCSADIF